jgi:hypothetical protein
MQIIYKIRNVGEKAYFCEASRIHTKLLHIINYQPLCISKCEYLKAQNDRNNQTHAVSEIPPAKTTTTPLRPAIPVFGLIGRVERWTTTMMWPASQWRLGTQWDAGHIPLFDCLTLKNDREALRSSETTVNTSRHTAGNTKRIESSLKKKNRCETSNLSSFHFFVKQNRTKPGRNQENYPKLRSSRKVTPYSLAYAYQRLAETRDFQHRTPPATWSTGFTNAYVHPPIKTASHSRFLNLDRALRISKPVRNRWRWKTNWTRRHKIDLQLQMTKCSGRQSVYIK